MPCIPPCEAPVILLYSCVCTHTLEQPYRRVIITIFTYPQQARNNAKCFPIHHFISSLSTSVRKILLSHFKEEEIIAQRMVFSYVTEDPSARSDSNSVPSDFKAPWYHMRLPKATCMGVTWEFWAGFLELPLYLLLSNCPVSPNIPLGLCTFYSSAENALPYRVCLEDSYSPFEIQLKCLFPHGASSTGPFAKYIHTSSCYDHCPSSGSHHPPHTHTRARAHTLILWFLIEQHTSPCVVSRTVKDLRFPLPAS